MAVAALRSPPEEPPAERIVLGKVGAVVIVNKDSPIGSITLQDLREILGQNGQQEQRDKGIAKKMKCFGVDPTCLAFQVVQSTVMREQMGMLEGYRLFRKDFNCQESRERVFQIVRSDPTAIGVLPWCSGAFPQGIRIVPVAPEADQAAVEPSIGSICDGTYPIARGVALFMPHDASESVNALKAVTVSERGAAIAAGEGIITPYDEYRYNCQKRLEALSAGAGVRIAAIGAEDGKKAVSDLCMEFMRAKAVVQSSYSVAESDVTAVASFIQGVASDSTVLLDVKGDGRKVISASAPSVSAVMAAGGKELLLLKSRPSEMATELHGKKWAELNPQEYLLAGRAVGIAVHSQCKLESVTLAQLQQVFSGQVADWNVLGEPAGRINVHVLNPENAVRAVFAKVVLPAEKWVGVKQVKDTAAALSAVSMNRNAIAFVDLAAMPESGQAVKLLAIDAGGRAFAPTVDNIRSGSYPLAERLFLYVHPQASDRAKDFAKFMATCGALEANPYQDTYAAVAEAYHKNGWIPLAPKPTTQPAYRLPTTRPVSVALPPTTKHAVLKPTTQPAGAR